MKKRFFTRAEIQEILEGNPLQSQVSYVEREDKNSPDNYIVYYRLSPNASLTADNGIHIRKVLVQVTHFHKKKLDSIEELIAEHFGVEPIQFDLKQPDTDYFATYYRFEILTSGRW
ncbi:TPA: hypothetical protein ACGO8F_001418 [Streptococcus suis]